MYKLLVLDLDDTLLNSDREISSRNNEGTGAGSKSCTGFRTSDMRHDTIQ